MRRKTVAAQQRVFKYDETVANMNFSVHKYKGIKTSDNILIPSSQTL